MDPEKIEYFRGLLQEEMRMLLDEAEIGRASWRERV